MMGYRMLFLNGDCSLFKRGKGGFGFGVFKSAAGGSRGGVIVDKLVPDSVGYF